MGDGNTTKEGIFLSPKQFEITAVVIYGDYYRIEGLLLLERFACSGNLFCHIKRQYRFCFHGDRVGRVQDPNQDQ